MGCVKSKKDINDVHPNIFQVSNVDDYGSRLSSGQLEVNETEIVFHQRGKLPIRWPLKTLRRYGYDSQVFSFETGRRCPTGCGIYAFSCKRAEGLFNYVQSYLQLRNIDLVSRDAETPTPVGLTSRTQESNYLEPNTLRQSLPRLSILNGPSRLSSVGSSNGCTSPSPTLPNNNYANESFFRLDEKLPGPMPVPEESAPVEVIPVPSNAYQNLPLNSKEAESEKEEEARVYINVTPRDSQLLKGNLSPTEDHEESVHCYANVFPGDIESLSKLNIRLPLCPTNSIATPSTATTTPLEPVSPSALSDRVNYIVLDLDKSASPSSPVALVQPESPKASEGYVTIDFDKTAALSHSVKPSFGHDNEGSRKTRHSSTINDLVPVSTTSRHSSSLSD